MNKKLIVLIIASCLFGCNQDKKIENNTQNKTQQTSEIQPQDNSEQIDKEREDLNDCIKLSKHIVQTQENVIAIDQVEVLNFSKYYIDSYKKTVEDMSRRMLVKTPGNVFMACIGRVYQANGDNEMYSFSMSTLDGEEYMGFKNLTEFFQEHNDNLFYQERLKEVEDNQKLSLEKLADEEKKILIYKESPEFIAIRDEYFDKQAEYKQAMSTRFIPEESDQIGYYSSPEQLERDRASDKLRYSEYKIHRDQIEKEFQLYEINTNKKLNDIKRKQGWSEEFIHKYDSRGF